MDLLPGPTGAPTANRADTPDASWSRSSECCGAIPTTSARATTTSMRSRPRRTPQRAEPYADKLARTCARRRPSRAHAGAHLHPHRPLSRRHARAIPPQAAPMPPSSPSATAAMASIRSATSRTTGISRRDGRVARLAHAGDGGGRTDGAARRPHPMQALSFMQQFVVAPFFAQVRFGQWDAILALERAAGTAAISAWRLAFRARNGTRAPTQAPAQRANWRRSK